MCTFAFKMLIKYFTDQNAHMFASKTFDQLIIGPCLQS